jgi:hypothetical protein
MPLLRQFLPRLFDVAMKDEQSIRVPVGIGEVELPALPQLDTQILVLVVDLK